VWGGGVGHFRDCQEATEGGAKDGGDLKSSWILISLEDAFLSATWMCPAFFKGSLREP